MQINLSRNNSILVCSFYRQWSIPSALHISNSSSTSSQVDRCKIFSSQIDKACQESRDLIILTDENIDSLDEGSNTKYLRNIELKTIKESNIIEYSLVYHNKLPTFFRKGVKSCVDFIISNCPSKIHNVRTHYDGNDIFEYKDREYNNIMSDHAMLSCTYNNKNIKKSQQFRIVRDSKLLTKHNLNEYLANNEVISTVFNYTDPNSIAEILINELSLIIECIAPSKKVQCSNNYAPWISQDFINESKVKDYLHN